MVRMLPLVLIVAMAGFASAEPIQTRGPELFPGSNALSVHIGYQAGFGSRLTDTSGFKFFFDYGHRLSDLVWLNLQLNQVFGGSSGVGTCIAPNGRPYACGGYYYSNGWGTELGIGVKLKIRTPIPLVVEIPIGGALVGMYDRPCGDDGVAVPVLRSGGGVKYFITRHIGLGGGFNFDFGPGFHGSAPGCGQGSWFADFYGTFDFQVGAEFIL